MNAIEHGAKMDPTKYLELAYVRGKNMVMCRVKDPGEGFTLDEIPHSAIGNPSDDPMLHMEISPGTGHAARGIRSAACAKTRR